MLPTLQVGPYTVIALPDSAGPFFSPRSEAFPTATDAQWSAADRFDPGAVDTLGRWWLQFRAFAVRGDRGVTLVDAGIGPADSPAASWAPVPGALPASLATAGIQPTDVDTVVLTHLHTDHVGWAVVGGDHARPFFPNAEYVLQRAEIAAIDEINPQLRSTLIDPLRSSGQLRLLDGDTLLRHGELALATPGHTPGHQSVLVESGRDLVALTGDLLVHAIQLLHPELAYAHEMDAERARSSRERVLRGRSDGALHLATPHLTEPFIAHRPGDGHHRK
ncbi:MBL fold metallo-hydrolase [Streptomyces sp. NPDC048590]|uniref:MBL fold metallo-hydrolase n=1 Tax=Streptomyces sp. NPDC048590 TaxID=3365574 RepID=UPI00371B3402